MASIGIFGRSDTALWATYLVSSGSEMNTGSVIRANVNPEARISSTLTLYALENLRNAAPEAVCLSIWSAWYSHARGVVLIVSGEIEGEIEYVACGGK